MIDVVRFSLKYFYLQAEMLPWIFCLQTLLAEQALPVADLLGILIGKLNLNDAFVF
jgi:hypothetical protein